MRRVLILALLAHAPSAALADEFDDAQRSLGSPTPTGTWELDDGAGVSEFPWDEYDAALSYGPRGRLHWGLEARVGLVPTESRSTSMRPHLELHGFADVRYSPRSPWRFRIGLVVGAEPFESNNLGGGTVVTSSVFSARVRILPLSVDLGDNFGLRAGGDIGLQVVPGEDGSTVLPDGAGIVQLVGRSDDGRLEIGAYLGMRVTGIARLERANFFSSGRSTNYVADAITGISTGYLF